MAQREAGHGLEGRQLAAFPAVREHEGRRVVAEQPVKGFLGDRLRADADPLP